MAMRKISEKTITYMYYLAAIMILFGVAVGLAVEKNIIVNIIYLLGGILYYGCYLIKPKSKNDIRSRRLDNMNAFAGILFVVSALFKLELFTSLGTNLWVLFLTMAVIFMAYSFIITLVSEKKTQKGQHKKTK